MLRDIPMNLPLMSLPFYQLKMVPSLLICQEWNGFICLAFFPFPFLLLLRKKQKMDSQAWSIGSYTLAYLFAGGGEVFI